MYIVELGVDEKDPYACRGGMYVLWCWLLIGLQRWYFCIVEQGVDDKDPYASKGVVCIVELGVDDNDAYPLEVVCVHCGAGC